MAGGVHNHLGRGGGARALTRCALWAAALGLSSWLAYLRWKHTSAAPIGIDFRYSLGAARDIAAGRSPYLIREYVYPPPLALALALFAHVRAETVWKWWAAVVVAAPFAGLSAFLALIRGPKSWWLRPAAFAVFGFTLVYSHYYPMSRDLAFGQTDTILFSVLAVAAVAASAELGGPAGLGGAARAAGAARLRGAMIGAAGLVKVWPWSAVVGVLVPGVQRRRTVLLSALAVAILAPLSALVFGWSGLTGLVRNDFHARHQNLVSDSVWSIPSLLFSHTHLARPLLTSTGLRLFVTAVLVVWVLALLAVVLRSATDGALATWNLLFCIVLLLPVSHRQYALLVLPLLWWWAITWVTRGASDRRIAAVVALLVLWWLDQTIAWPYNGSSHAITSLRYSVPFFFDLLACTVSVVGARLLVAGTAQRAPDTA